MLKLQKVATMTLTKALIAEKIAEVNGFSKKKNLGIVEQLIDIIKHRLENGEEIRILGFGKFYVRKNNPRLGRNPATGARLNIRGRKVVKFKCSRKLKDKIKNNDNRFLL